MVREVTPVGAQTASGFSPFTQIIELTTVDGSDVERRRADRADRVRKRQPHRTSKLWGFFSGIGGRLIGARRGSSPTGRGGRPDADRDRVEQGYLDYGNDELGVFETIDRGFLEYLLMQSIWIAALGLFIGLLVLAGAFARSRRSRRGRAWRSWSEPRRPCRSCCCRSCRSAPAVGIYAGYVVPAALALLLGLTFARAQHQTGHCARPAWSSPSWPRHSRCCLCVRYMTSPALSPDDRVVILTVVAAIAVVPAVSRRWQAAESFH